MDLTSTVKNTGKKMKRAVLPESAEASSDILRTLRREHEEASELLEKITESESATERKALLKKLQGALIPHLRAEEKVVYDAIIALSDKKLQQDGKEGALEHELAERTLAKL